tara:strand:+ start:2372 stop:2524 length:153 start_codon:yes stop_codon:yes gene_type:complete
MGYVFNPFTGNLNVVPTEDNGDTGTGIDGTFDLGERLTIDSSFDLGKRTQ